MTNEDIKKEVLKLLDTGLAPWEREDLLRDVAISLFGKKFVDEYDAAMYDYMYGSDDDDEDDDDKISTFVYEHSDDAILSRIDNSSIVDYVVENRLVGDVLRECDGDMVIRELEDNCPLAMDEIQNRFDPIKPLLEEDEADRIHDLAYHEGYEDGYRKGVEAMDNNPFAPPHIARFPNND